MATQSFKALAENAPDMIARFDQEHRYLYVNPVIEDMTGSPAEFFRGKTNHELGMPRSLSALWERELAHVLETGQQTRFQFDTAAPDGKRHYDARLAPELGDDGAVQTVLAIVRDVTDQEETRQTLLRYAGRLQFLQEVNRAIRATYSAEEAALAALPFSQQLLDCSRASVSLFDREAGEALLLAVYADHETRLGEGMRLPLEWEWFLRELEQGKICTIYDLPSLESPANALQILRDEGVQSMISVPLIVQEKLIGSLNLGLTSFEALTAEQEQIAQEIANQLAIAIHQAALHQRVQDHAQALEETVARRAAALRASEARFRAIFENAAMGIALMDTKGRLVSSNPALQKMLGYDAQELKGMNVAQFIHPDDIAMRDAFFQELLAGQRDHFRMEKRYIRKDGTILWVRPAVSLIRTVPGAPRLVIKMVDDITEEKRMREALIHAERLTLAGQLGASLTHEISNPLQSVVGSLGLAAEMLEDESQVQEFIKIAMEELERATDIVAQLRDLNRKSEPEERRPAQLNQIVEKVLLLNKKRGGAQQIEVEWIPEADLPAVAMVADRIRQVFLNLTLNAIEAMPEGGRLQVTTSRTTEPDGVQIVFADSGRGIDPDLLPHLFVPFHSTRPEGLGLGLYISKSIVEEHGGHIEASSQAGQGATFSVWLPLHESQGSKEAGHNQ